jgi:hypothetical protein
MKSTFDRLREYWITCGCDVNPGADLSSIARCEQKRAVVLPQQLREYLQTINGMTDGSTDDEFISFHSIQCLDDHWEWYPRREPECVEIVFADYCINAHWYVLHADQSGADLGVWVTDSYETKKLAACFADFIAAYLSNPRQIADCW